MTSIKNLKSFDDVDIFLKDMVMHVGSTPAFKDGSVLEIGVLGGRKFKNAAGTKFTMNQVIKKLAEITKKTVKGQGSLNNELQTLDKVLKEIKELDTLGYSFSRDKETVSLFRRMMTTIRQGFGISEKIRNQLYKDIEELRVTVKTTDIVLEQPVEKDQS